MLSDEAAGKRTDNDGHISRLFCYRNRANLPVSVHIIERALFPPEPPSYLCAVVPPPIDV